jgi:hypothetical protein
MGIEQGVERSFQFVESLAGGILDMVFGRGGDGVRGSSAEDYIDSSAAATPDIHIHGNLHTDQGISQSQAPASLDQLPTIGNAIVLQEAYAQPNNSPVHEMRAPDYPPMPDRWPDDGHNMTMGR